MKRKSSIKRRGSARSELLLLLLTVVIGVVVGYFHEGRFFAVSAQKTPRPKSDEKVSPEAARQIEALTKEKKSRSKAQEKIEARLLHEIKKQRGEPLAEGVMTLSTGVKVDSEGYVEVEISANVSDKLINTLKKAGTEIIAVFPQYHSIVARMPIDSIEGMAARPDIIHIQTKAEAMTNSDPRPPEPLFSANSILGLRTEWAVSDRRMDLSERRARVRAFLNSHIATLTGSQTAESDVTHRSGLARSLTGFNGAGITIGVLSDGVASRAARQASGDLPPTGPGPGTLNVLAGQAGPASGDEGTAMLEIVHDVAPGATLFFATGFSTNAQMATNIKALRTAGCDIIIDDLTYFNETPFQDGQVPPVVSPGNAGAITQAVTDVTVGSQAGALYFSSAGNSGNKNDNESGVWEGDYVNAGPAGSPIPDPPGPSVAGDFHNFGGGATFDTLTADGRVLLKWSDPLGASNNDYDLYVLNSAGTAVVVAADGAQNGNDDPVEDAGNRLAGERLVVVKFSGADRFLQLNTNRGLLSISTSGTVYGHNSSRNAMSVAATPAGPVQSGTSFPAPFPFAHFTTNVVETFSSDGPRRIFYNADGTAITPGNVSSTGGEVLQKPDITAADGVTTTTPNFIPFFGTSAAAPQAGAMMALLKDASPGSTNAQLIAAMRNSALDIEAPGADRDSGAGIFMPLRAMNALGGIAGPAFVDLGGPVTATEVFGNGNGRLEPAEVGGLPIRLDNLGLTNATNISATLSTSTTGVTIIPSATRTYPNLAAAIGSATATPQFQFRLAVNFPCGAPVDFTLTITYTGGASPQEYNFQLQTGGPSTVATTLDATAPVGLGYTAVTNNDQVGRLNRNGVVSSCGAPKPTPGLQDGAVGRRYDAYTYTASAAGCVTVSITPSNTNALQSAAYNGTYNPLNVQTNYLADYGNAAAVTTIQYSFNVTAGQQFVVVVNELVVGGGNGVNYTLNVSGPLQGVCQSFTPTAGEVSIEGRVLIRGGRTLENTTVTLTSPDGIQRIAVTNAFGVYRFTDVPAGEAYVIVPVSTRYRFTPLVLNITEDLTGVDFNAETFVKK